MTNVELPTGWTMHTAPDGRTPYYYLHQSKFSSWIHPRELPAQAIPPPVARLDNRKQHARRDKTKTMEDIPGAGGWKRVTTVQGRTFYYNMATAVSTWKEPMEVSVARETTLPPEEDAPEEVLDEFDEEDAEWQLRMMEEETEEAEAEEDFAFMMSRPKEERVAIFTGMLVEKKISPMEVWEEVVASLEGDRRYALLETGKEKRAAFDVYCRDFARSIAEEKKATKADPAALKKFRTLLKDKVFKSTKWDDFVWKHRKDVRFTGLEGKDREKLFLEHTLQLGGRTGKGLVKEAKEAFREMLREMPRITKSTESARVFSECGSDPRFVAISIPSVRDALYGAYVKSLSK